MVVAAEPVEATPVAEPPIGGMRPEILLPIEREHIDLFDRIFLFLIWVREGRCIIQNRDTNNFEPLRLRRVQLAVVQEMLRQAATCPRCLKQTFGYGRDNWRCKHCEQDAAEPSWRGLPVRIIIPKARKMGMSTLIQAWGVFCVEHFPGVYALTLAHTADDTRKIFDIALRVHMRGQFDPTNRPSFIAEPWGSTYLCKTGGGKFVGSGGTPTILHISELAKWTGKKGDANADKEAMASLLGSIPFAPHTCVFIESTGMGPSGDFYRRCEKAHRLQFGEKTYIAYGEDGEEQEDETTLGFRLMFFPWWQDSDYAIRPRDGWTPGEDEEAIREAVEAEYGVRLTDDQLYWRHWKMQSDDMDDITFTREFPNTFLDCFAAMEGRVYPRFTWGPSHCREMQLTPFLDAMKDPANDSSKVGLIRAMDVGTGGTHFWVVLWIAYNNSEPPALVVNPRDEGCQQLMKEMMMYAMDPKQDRPKKEHDHGPDALRYAVVGGRLTGLVYVYRALYYQNIYATENAQQMIVRDIYEKSGWELPDESDGMDLNDYRPGPFAEHFTHNICDRSARAVINLFNSWGLPFTAHERPAKQLQVKDEVNWGVAHVNALITSTAWIEAPRVDEHAKLLQEALDRLHGRTPLGRRIPLTEAHKDALRKEGIPFGRVRRRA